MWTFGRVRINRRDLRDQGRDGSLTGRGLQELMDKTESRSSPATMLLQGLFALALFAMLALLALALSDGHKALWMVLVGGTFTTTSVILQSIVERLCTPAGPRTMTLSTSRRVAPTSAMRKSPCSAARAHTHSAPARVLPAPARLPASRRVVSASI